MKTVDVDIAFPRVVQQPQRLKLTHTELRMQWHATCTWSDGNTGFQSWILWCLQEHHATLLEGLHVEPHENSEVLTVPTNLHRLLSMYENAQTV